MSILSLDVALIFSCHETVIKSELAELLSVDATKLLLRGKEYPSDATINHWAIESPLGKHERLIEKHVEALAGMITIKDYGALLRMVAYGMYLRAQSVIDIPIGSIWFGKEELHKLVQLIPDISIQTVFDIDCEA